MLIRVIFSQKVRYSPVQHTSGGYLNSPVVAATSRSQAAWILEHFKFTSILLSTFQADMVSQIDACSHVPSLKLLQAARNGPSRAVLLQPSIPSRQADAQDRRCAPTAPVRQSQCGHSRSSLYHFQTGPLIALRLRREHCILLSSIFFLFTKTRKHCKTSSVDPSSYLPFDFCP